MYGFGVKGMETCKYCGKPVVKKGKSYCDKTCFRLFLSVTVNFIMENAERMNKVDKFILIDLPLWSYNKFFSRNVTERDYTESFKEISSKNIPIEMKILVAYYNAAKMRAGTYIPLSMVRSAVATQRAFYVVKSLVFDATTKTPLNVEDRVRVERDGFVDELLNRKIIDNADLAKMKDVRERLGTERYMNRVGHGIATVYIESLIAGVRVKQDDIEAIMRRNMVTIRNISVEIVKDMKEKNKIVVNGRFVSVLKNLSSATVT